MAKASLREDFPIVHPPPQTADQLVAAIAHLYHQLDPYTGKRPSLAYTALEAQIRILARQHWALVA